MNTIFDEYSALWPTSRREALKPSLKQVYCLHYPSETEALGWANKRKTIIIVEPGHEANFTKFFLQGYEHVIYKERKDFPQELLASSLMVLRPEAFCRNPMPFFFTGFQAPETVEEKDRNLILEFSDSQQKRDIKEGLRGFFGSNSSLRVISDIVLQVADEMISNAIFNAPMLEDGTRPFAKLPRTSKVSVPDGKSAKLFASFSGPRIVVGCEDPFGSLERDAVMSRLAQIYSDKPVVGGGSSAAVEGLGMKLMIDNAVNFYIYSEKRKKTVIACAFLIGGKRENMTAAKHVHFSVR